MSRPDSNPDIWSLPPPVVRRLCNFPMFAMASVLPAWTLIAAVSLLCASDGLAETTPLTSTDTSYRADKHWLCRPGRDDVCAQPVTVVSGINGDVQTLRADPAAPVDCFYVYPTVSNDDAPNSDLEAGPEERRAALHQLVAFGRECRLFAPVYRQVTLPALRSRFTSTPMPASPEMAFGDVRAAWNDYLAHDNQGRGVVLVGHSQGARILANLIAREIEGRPVQKQIVAALLLGSNIAVPKGRDVGGDFRSTPLCRSVSQIGCVVAYTSYRADSPPPADALFGRAGTHQTAGADPADIRVACTNPAALGGGAGNVQALMPARENLMGQPISSSAVGTETNLAATTLLALPTLRAECVEVNGASVLSVDLPAQVPGDVVVNGEVLRNWGLHLVDVNLALGSLIHIVREKARAWTGR